VSHHSFTDDSRVPTQRTSYPVLHRHRVWFTAPPRANAPTYITLSTQTTPVVHPRLPATLRRHPSTRLRPRLDLPSPGVLPPSPVKPRSSFKPLQRLSKPSLSVRAARLAPPASKPANKPAHTGRSISPGVPGVPGPYPSTRGRPPYAVGDISRFMPLWSMRSRVPSLGRGWRERRPLSRLCRGVLGFHPSLDHHYLEQDLTPNRVHWVASYHQPSSAPPRQHT
jgi:hypothetical protein